MRQTGLVAETVPSVRFDVLNATFWFGRKVGNPAIVPNKALQCQNPTKHCEIKSKKDTAEVFFIENSRCGILIITIWNHQMHQTLGLEKKKLPNYKFTLLPTPEFHLSGEVK